MPSMNFILTGRDHLSRVMDRAGDASDRLGRRLLTMSINSDAAVRRFTNNTTRNIAGMQRDTEAGGKALEELKKTALLLAPAAIPAAASLLPIAAGAGTVAVAVGAMTAAIVPQIGALGEVAEAQKKYDDAVAKSGATSDDAVKAQVALAQTMAKLPPETRRAAAELGVLKEEYGQWSDSLAGDTMAPVTKGIQIFNALLPKTTGLVKSASRETDRFMTLVGGEMASPGLDRLDSKFTSFADKTLRSVNDEIVHLLRVQDSGGGGGKTQEFLDWARAQGPAVASVLRSVAEALLHVLDGASQTGVGLLQVIEVLAKLVSAVPPGAIATFLQLALVLKVVKTAALGMAAARSALIGFTAQLLAMQTAAAAAPTRLRAVGAAIGAMSRSAKVAVAGTGIGLLLLALTELSQRGKQTPPDVDKLTSSLKQLGSTGKVTGEVAKAFGSDLDGLYDKVRSLTDPSTTDKVQQFLVGWTGWDSTPVADAKENIGAVDEALANLVSSGQSDLAAAAVKRLTAEYGKGGRDTSEFTSKLDGYKSALADAKFEQQLAADSMGLFGAQSQSVQTKLDAQKKSADGLRQSIQALNDAQRAGLGGMIGFEASIDAAAKAAKDNAGALSMTHGQLDLNSEKARGAASALQDLASKTDEAAASARESGASWSTVSGIYERGRAQFIQSARAMGLTKKEASALADQILKIPDKKTVLRGDVQDLQAKVDAAQKKVDGLRQRRKTAVGADKAELDQKIKAAQAKLDALRQKTAVAIRAVDKSSSVAAAIKRAIDNVRSKTVTLTTVRHTINVEATAARSNKNLNGYASGGSPKAGEMAMVGEEGPELVVFGQAARVFDTKTTKNLLSGSAGAGQAAAQGLAAGLASTGGVYAAARSMAAAITVGIRDEMEIASPSKKTKALAKDIGKGLIVGLTASRDKIKATAKDLAADIRTAFSGKKEDSLLRYVDKQTAKLLAAAKKRDAVAARIAEAKSFASDVTKNARQGAGLGNLGMEPEEVTAGGIKAGLASKLAKIKQFTTYINTLAKKGLNKSLLKQILNMGPEDGYAYASALVGADKATFASVNKLQSQLNDSTTKLGRVGADRLYDSGKNASKGFLAGLESEEKQLEKTMIKLAKSMQKALKKALGIKSPARAMIPDGINTARGVAVGVLAGLPHVDSAMRTMAGRMAGRAAIGPVTGRAAAVASRQAAAPIVIHVSGALDPHAVAEQIHTLLLTYKRGRGGGDLGIA